MKKILGIAVSLALVLTAAGVAGANSIIVPFFSDGGALATDSPPQGLAGFIQLKNLEDEAIVVLVEYADMNGVDGGAGTFELAANTATGWRPVRNDPAFEGPAADLIPDANGAGTLATNDGNGDGVSDSGGNGGVVISSEGRIVGAAVSWNLGTGAGWSYPALEFPE